MEVPIDVQQRSQADLHKFVIVDEILAECPGVQVPGGSLYSIDNLFAIVEERSPSLFSSSSSLREFISVRPHLFRLTPTDQVGVRIDEDRRKFIEVVRFIAASPSPVSIETVIEGVWKETAKAVKRKGEKKGKENGHLDDDNGVAENKWWNLGGPWRRSSVWRAMKRGGEGVFRVNEDEINLTEEALANDSFFNDVYINYNAEVVKDIETKLENAKDEEERKNVHKQRQYGSTQVNLLGVARDVKSKYIKSLILAPPEYTGQTIYILPNQIKEKKKEEKNESSRFHIGHMMLVRAHDVVGDESLKNRFRADEMKDFHFSEMDEYMPKKATLGLGFKNPLNKKRLTFDRRLKEGVAVHKIEGKEGEKEKDPLKAEFIDLHASLGSNTEMVYRLLNGEQHYSEFPLQTTQMQEEFSGYCQFEKFFVKEMDHLIKCGIKKRIEHGEVKEEEKEEESYPFDDLLKDLEDRSITTPNAIPIIGELSMDELWKEVSLRPHLYRIYGRESNSSSFSVGFCQREAIDRLLSALDTRPFWSMQKLKLALGEGKAGEEWKDELAEELVDGLYPLIRREGEFLSLGMRRRGDGLWIREEPALIRGTKIGEKKRLMENDVLTLDDIEDSDEETVQKDDMGWTVEKENGVRKVRGRGGVGPRIIPDSSDSDDTPDSPNSTTQDGSNTSDNSDTPDNPAHESESHTDN